MSAQETAEERNANESKQISEVPKGKKKERFNSRRYLTVKISINPFN